MSGEQSPSTTPARAQVWGAVGIGIVVMATMGMVVGLAFAGWKPESITALAIGVGAPLATLIGVVAKVLGINAEQSKTINEIAENVNGNLTARIRREFNSILNDREVSAARRAAYVENVQREGSVSEGDTASL